MVERESSTACLQAWRPSLHRQAAMFERVGRPILSSLLIGLVGLIGGCKPDGVEGGDRARQGASGQAAACSQIARADLVLPGGRLADARIVQVRDTRLYIPTDWVRVSGYFVDEPTISEKPRRSPFEPAMLRDECPGTIHHTSDNIAGYSEIDFRFAEDLRAPTVHNISPSSVVREIYLTQAGGGESGATAAAMAADESWQQIRRYQSQEPSFHGWHPTGNGQYIDAANQKHDLNPWFLVRFNAPEAHSAIQWVLPQIMFRYRTPFTSDELPRWRELRKPMRELGQWLATPPNQRDNDRVFLLGERKS